ncbi:MAG: hypothetical protein H7210_12520 [Pyrinomonadaceae bacterium]|nr:hypothetical protein [Phycisphaerales bacterium]
MKSKHTVAKARLSISLAAGALALSAGQAAAQVSLQVVAHTGQPFDINRVHVSFDHAVINDDGHVLFLGRTGIDTPANDECAGAIEIFPGLTSLGNSYATTNAMPSWCGVLDSWYRFTATETATISLQASCGFPAHFWQLYSGSCGALTLRSQYCGSGAGIFSGQITAGQTYYLRVGSRTSAPPPSATGITTFTLRRDTVRADSLPAWDNYLFINRGAGNIPVLHEGDVTSFDPELSYRGLGFGALAGGDAMALSAAARTVAPTEPTGLSLVTGDADGPLTQELRDFVLPPPGVNLWRVPIPQLTIDGHSAYTQNAGDLLRVGSRSIASGDAAPGTGDGVTFNFLDQPVIAGRTFAFRSTLAGDGLTDANNMGLWVDLNDGVQNGPTLVARLGDPAPGTGKGIVFASLPLAPALNENLEFAFVAKLTGGDVTPETSVGLWRGVPSEVSLLGRAGDAAPGLTGVVFRDFARQASLNRRGDLLVRAFLAGKSISAANDVGLWIASAGGTLQLIAREGEQAPGLSEGVLFDRFSDPVLGAAGDVAYFARLRGSGIDRTNQDAIFLRTKDGRSRLVARRGDSIPLPDGSTRTIRTLTFGDGVGAGHDSLNASSQIVFHAEFSDLTQAVLITERPCAGDWNHSGGVNSEDFFAFLTEYFVGVADFNRDGYANSQDFFDFLQAFFAGC